MLNFFSSKKLILAFFILLVVGGSFIFALPSALAQTTPAATTKEKKPIYYWPNLSIPGMDKIFTETREETDKATGLIHTEYKIDGASLAKYIKTVYNYAGVIAGAFAMFMLVYGAWQWLMAGGNASKVTMAKETVTTTLIGLAFLFGGYLLLSQISTNLVIFKPLNVKDVEIKDTCSTYTDSTSCTANSCLWVPNVNQTVDNPTSGTCLWTTDSGQRCPVEDTLKPYFFLGKISISCPDSRLTPATAGALQTAVFSLVGTGEKIVLTSAFRSWIAQDKLYKCYLNCTADCNDHCNEAAEPNCITASHMTGTAVDVCYQDSSRNIDTCLYMKSQFNCLNSTTAPCTQSLHDGQIILRQKMGDAGFAPYAAEWWHFKLK